MMKNSNDKIANDLANLIDITVEVQHISPDDIIICGIMHRDDQKVHTTNKLLSSMCIRKGCKFLVPDFKRHHYRDNVHLDSSGMELWLSQIAIHCSQILGVAYIQPTQSQNDEESASHTVLFNGKDHILSNHYPCPIQVDGKTFHSSEQLYQYKMAILGDYSKIAEDILHTRSASHAQRLGGVIQKDRDLGLSVLWEVINIKIEQCQDFRSFLLNTNDKNLIENTRNTFWGRGVNNDGRNMFGKMLMRPSGQILTDADFTARLPTKPTNTPSNWGRKPLHMPMPYQHPQSRQPSQYTSSSYSRPSPRNIAPLDQNPQGDGAQFHHAPQHDGAQFHHAPKRDGAQFHHAPQYDVAQFHHAPQRDVAPLHDLHQALNVMVLNSVMPLNVMVLNSIMPLNVMLLHYMIYIKPLNVMVLNSVMPLNVMVLNSIMPLNMMLLNSIMPRQRDVAPLHDLHQAFQRDGAQFHHAPQRDGAQFHHAPNVMVLNSIMPLNVMVLNSIMPPT